MEGWKDNIITVSVLVRRCRLWLAALLIECFLPKSFILFKERLKDEEVLIYSTKMQELKDESETQKSDQPLPDTAQKASST